MNDAGYQSEARATDRGLRPSPRDSNPRLARAPTDGPRLQRRRHQVNIMESPKPPPGFTYEWKAEKIYGEPQNEHIIDIRENHWKQVPASRHPEYAMGSDTVIRRKDTVLYERPTYLVDEARMEQIEDAMKPVLHQEQIMYGGAPDQLTRDHPSVRRISKINQQYAPGAPISDDGPLSSEP
jgi:hypothetical protein